MIRAAALALLALAAPAAAQDLSAADIAALPPALQAHVADAAESCAGIDGGTLSVSAAALTRPDLNRDGTPDWILDDGYFSCSTAASLFCGSGGCNSTILIDDIETEVFAKKIEVFEGEFMTTLIAWVHGNACGGDNGKPCALALVWDQGAWSSVAARE